MREEGDVLWNVSDVPSVRRQVHTCGGVKEHAVAHRDPARLGRPQASDGVEHRRLTGSRWSEERGDPGPQLLVDVEEESTLAQPECQVDHARTPARAVIQFDNQRAPNASAAETPTSCTASLSRPVSANE